MPIPLSEEAIFDLARKIESVEARADYLHQSCGDDIGMLERVRALLEVHDEQADFLEAPPSAVDRTVELPVAERPGMVIGNYKLMEQIGEGGMGVVFVAQQQHPVTRKVALKIVKPGMDTKEVIARFEAERQALALMDHPNIAKVFDAAATESGRPYFVMELVKGMPITEYCDQKKLNARQRLELFVATCNAIQHAHLKGVIHRDVKPSNVLITEHDGTPVPKVIDFGVAKATNQRLTDLTIYTRHQQLVGTPLYMSPEQAELSGLDVDTRTDVYSLGVLLYELLTGVTPFERKRFHEAAYDEIRRIIREEDPPKPSTRVSTLGDAAPSVFEGRQTDAGRLRHTLAGELDWIVMKALEKDRSRRYETARGFALDIQRFLNQEAVLACPPSVAYQIRKFARRHRGPVVVGLLLLFLLCVAVGGTTSGWLNALDARRKSEGDTEAARAAEHRAEQALITAKAAAERLHLDNYVSDIGLAYEAIGVGDLPFARALLEDYQPAPGESDVRGFEWRWLWSLSQGNYTADLGPYKAFLSGVAVSPDGSFAATHRTDPWRLVAINLDSGERESTIAEETGNPLFFSPSGKILAASHNGKVKVLDTQTWESRTGLDAEFPLFAFGHRTEPEIFVALNGSRLSVYDATNWKKIRDLENSPDRGELLSPGFGQDWHMTNTVAISGDDKVAYLASAEGIRRWDLGSGRELPRFQVTNPERLPPADDPSGKWGEGLSAVATSGDGQLAVADRWGRVHLIEPSSGRVIHRFLEHTGWTPCLKFSEDGTKLFSAGSDRKVVAYDPQRREVVKRLLGHPRQIWGLDVSADGRVVVGGSGYGGHNLMWSLADEGQPGLEDWGVTRWAVLEDNRILVLRPPNKRAEYYDPWKESLSPVGQQPRLRELLHSGGMLLAASPDSQWFVVRHDGKLMVWDIAGDEPHRLLLEQADASEGARFSWDSRRLAVGGRDTPVQLWRTDSWSSEVLVDTVPGVWVFDFSRDSRRLVMTGRDMIIRVFEIDEDKTRSIFTKTVTSLGGGNAMAYSAAISNDGRLLATGHQDALIRIWNLDTHELVTTLEGHVQGVFSLCFSADDRTLASACASATVRLWHVPTWRRLLGLQADVNHLQFSPDGRCLALNILASGSEFLPKGKPGLRVLKAPALAKLE